MAQFRRYLLWGFLMTPCALPLGGFLLAAGGYLLDGHPSLLLVALMCLPDQVSMVCLAMPMTLAAFPMVRMFRPHATHGARLWLSAAAVVVGFLSTAAVFHFQGKCGSSFLIMHFATAGALSGLAVAQFYFWLTEPLDV